VIILIKLLERRINMSLLNKLVIIFFVAAMTVGIYGCKKEGPAERAGKKIDKAIEDAKKTIDDATK